jgi:hypothetical protein
VINRFSKAALCSIVLSALTPATGHAQIPLSQILDNLLNTGVLLAPPPPGQPSHSAHFLPSTAQQKVPTFFNQEIATQLATFPTGSSSGGFSFTFNPTLGTFSRTTDSFGPSFAERALTNGRGRFTVGFNFQYSKFNSFEGKDLQNGDVIFYLRHAPCCGGAFFEGDLIKTALKLDLSTSTTSLYANFGVSDSFDVAVTVPIVHVSMSATVDATVQPLATQSIPIHRFSNGGGLTNSSSQSGSKTGIGDVLVRGKYRLFSAKGGGLAVGIDGRVPSGDSDNLLGTGAGQGTFTLIGSATQGNIAPHFNIGYTVSRAGGLVNIPDSFDYRAGVEWAASPTVTVAADFLGRTLRNAGRLVQQQTIWPFKNAAGVAGSTTFDEFNLTPGSLTQLLGAVGAKFNVAPRLLLSANALFQLNNAGFRANVTPVIGLEYSR